MNSLQQLQIPSTPTFLRRFKSSESNSFFNTPTKELLHTEESPFNQHSIQNLGEGLTRKKSFDCNSCMFMPISTDIDMSGVLASTPVYPPGFTPGITTIYTPRKQAFNTEFTENVDTANPLFKSTPDLNVKKDETSYVLTSSDCFTFGIPNGYLYSTNSDISLNAVSILSESDPICLKSIEKFGPITKPNNLLKIYKCCGVQCVKYAINLKSYKTNGKLFQDGIISLFAKLNISISKKKKIVSELKENYITYITTFTSKNNFVKTVNILKTCYDYEIIVDFTANSNSKLLTDFEILFLEYVNSLISN